MRREAVFCPPCADAVLPIGSTQLAGLDRFAAYGAYGGPLARAICRFKYEDRPELAASLASLLLRALPSADAVDVVVPVPLHPVRLAERGYNQSALLAKRVARVHGLRAGLRWLRRTEHRPPQAQLTGAERRQNLGPGSFRATPRVRGQRVLLVDDVATTGSTLHACADALRRAGATRVTAVVLAHRVDPDQLDRPQPDEPAWLLRAWLDGR